MWIDVVCVEREVNRVFNDQRRVAASSGQLYLLLNCMDVRQIVWGLNLRTHEQMRVVTRRLDAMRVARQLEPGSGRWTTGLIQNLIRLHRYDEALAEIEALDDRRYWLAFNGLMLNVREHGDLHRLATETEILADESRSCR